MPQPSEHQSSYPEGAPILLPTVYQTALENRKELVGLLSEQLMMGARAMGGGRGRGIGGSGSLESISTTSMHAQAHTSSPLVVAGSMAMTSSSSSGGGSSGSMLLSHGQQHQHHHHHSSSTDTSSSSSGGGNEGGVVGTSSSSSSSFDPSFASMHRPLSPTRSVRWLLVVLLFTWLVCSLF